MKNLINQLCRNIRFLVTDETGAQVVEYALIIAVIAIALVLALLSISGGSLATFIVRVTTCLTSVGCT